MDPLSAVGLASSVVQLIQFSTDVISKSREIYRSAAGNLVENVELETIARTLQSQSRRIATQAGERRFPSETAKALVALCEDVRNISQSLIDTIDGLRSNGPSSAWKSFYQALRSVWKEQDIADYLRRLETCRQQVDSLLLMHLQERLEVFTQEAKDREAQVAQNFAKLAESVKPGNRWQHELLGAALRSLENANATAARSVDDFSTSLSNGAEQDRHQFLRGRILESLKFSEMKDRYETISDAHRRTFDWAFHESEASDAHPDEGWDNFANWLRSNKPLYWITGKPGSGKSTLMKYLSDDPRLDSYLGVWERDKPICKAKFFLWNSGSAMQMSRMGLMQSLLHQALHGSPHEIPRVFLERWEYSQYFGYDHRPWSWPELSSSFKRLVDDDTRHFFFLIDGLDEFDGDCAELAGFLLKILEAGANVKMCLASRPWLVFEDAFRRRPSLRMEDLTLKDIELFASEKLGEHPMFSQLQEMDPKGAKQLVNEVTQKSTGVFLWVRLVVKSLLEGLRDGDTMEDLQARLLLLPQDLEALFRKILGDLDTTYFAEAAQIFQTVRASHVPWAEVNLEAKNHIISDNESSQHDRDNRSPLALLSLSFAKEDVERAFMNEFSKPMDYQQRLYCAETMRRRLASRCKGLLEVPVYKNNGPEAKVQYLHRTVKDFLNEASAQEFLSTDSSSLFRPHVALCASIIRHVKAISPTEDDWSGMQSFEGLLKQFVTQCHWIERSGSSDYVRFLDEMDALTVRILGYDTGPTADHDLPHWTKRIDPYIGRHAAIQSLMEYALKRRLNHYLLVKLNSGCSIGSSDDPYAYLLRRAEELGNSDLVELLETNGRGNLHNKPKTTCVPVPPVNTQKIGQQTHQVLAYNPTANEGNVQGATHPLGPTPILPPKRELQKQGMFGFRKAVNNLSSKFRSGH